MKQAFTLVELLVSIAIVALLLVLGQALLNTAQLQSSRVISCQTLRQLMVGGHGYLADHNQRFWAFSEEVPGGTLWWYGFESTASRWYTPEGQRILDYNVGPLSGAMKSSQMKTDPLFMQYSPRLKPKYQNGNYGYGYNTELVSNGVARNALLVQEWGRMVVFATCAQVNTIQAPASKKNPMIEEFCMINRNEVTVHFRHSGGTALAAFLDGSVRGLTMEDDMEPGSQDMKLPKANIGRLKSSYLIQSDW